MRLNVEWTDIEEIAIALDEVYPEVDVINLRFSDLRKWVLELEGFDDDPDRCNERILEAIQASWIDERDWFVY